MAEDLTLLISPKAKSFAIGKFLAAILVGVFFGVIFHQSNVGDHEKGQHLTLAAYSAEFEAHRAKLLQNDWPWWWDVPFFTALTLTFLGSYELLGLAIAWVCGRLSRKSPVDPVPSG